MTQRDDTSTRRWVLALTSAASFMVALDSLVITTALSTLRTDLDASIASLEWTVNAYLLSFAVLIITASALGDRYGRRRLFAWGIGLFTIASAACAVAPGVGWLIAARTIQGVGEALVLPLGMALLTAAYPADKRAGALGIFSGITGLAVLGGPVVGGAIAEGLDWRWIFWINVPIGLALIPLVLVRIRESVGARSAIDVPGVVLVTGSTLGLMWGLVRGNSAGWGSVEVLAPVGRSRSPSWPGSDAHRSRCCRWRSSDHAPSPGATPRASSSTRPCSAPSSSWPSSFRPRRGTDRSVPACDSCPGPRRSS